MRAVRQPRKPPLPAPLPAGARLGAFEVRGVLGLGEYGYGYRVWDPESEEEYAVKEYLPLGLAQREGERAVRPLRPEDEEAYTQGLRVFLDEGKLLSQLRHPGLVHVYGSWEENGTAYMAMRLVAGRNLQQTMQARGRPPREPALRALLQALLDALGVLHRAGIEHRDIGLSTIVIGPDHRPVLMDLGSPRRLASARGQAAVTGSREGFAPREMYEGGRNEKHGPWTDIYALGAVLYCLMTGKPPAPARLRSEADDALPWPAPIRQRYAPELRALVQWMLSPRPQDRPQDLAAVHAALAAAAGLPARLRPGRRDRLAVALLRHRRALRWLLVLLALLVLAALAFGGWRLHGLGLLPGMTRVE
ncbi:MAG TPA: serine/threonine-protein kinase [Rubrivivax sp.]|nr:serine/threonine-protein kinase [Rubrivivax sp.]